MKTGIKLIAEERQEQIEKHNRTIELDVQYNYDEQLRQFAITLLSEGEDGLFDESDLEFLPEGWEEDICRKMLLKPYTERLIIAGALIAAEIDRIQFLKKYSN